MNKCLNEKTCKILLKIETYVWVNGENYHYNYFFIIFKNLWWSNFIKINQKCLNWNQPGILKLFEI